MEGLIAQPVLPMFREPDPASEQVSQAILGMPVTATEHRSGWLRLRTPDGYEGWAPAEGVTEPPPAWRPPWLEVADLWANFRAAPDSRRASALTVFIGTRLPLKAEKPGWVEALLPDGSRLWVESGRVRILATGETLPAAPRAVCETARRFLGVPYLWGGCTPLGVDCSGFVQLVFRLHGIPLPRDAHQQATAGRPCDAPRSGDLVFFGLEGERITHVGLVLHLGRFIHAAGGDCVRIDRLDAEPHRSRFRLARRVLR